MESHNLFKLHCKMFQTLGYFDITFKINQDLASYHCSNHCVLVLHNSKHWNVTLFCTKNDLKCTKTWNACAENLLINHLSSKIILLTLVDKLQTLLNLFYIIRGAVQACEAYNNKYCYIPRLHSTKQVLPLVDSWSRGLD